MYQIFDLFDGGQYLLLAFLFQLFFVVVVEVLRFRVFVGFFFFFLNLACSHNICSRFF